MTTLASLLLLALKLFAVGVTFRFAYVGLLFWHMTGSFRSCMRIHRAWCEDEERAADE